MAENFAAGTDPGITGTAERGPAAGPVRGPLAEVPVEVTVSVGRARVAIRELMALAPDRVVALDRRVEDPVELRIGDRLIAYGELVEGEGEHAGMLAVRVTALAGPRGAT
ncbi:MAG: FliM/FliN family flagellar motor switch protein [Rhodobacteraceae bacterium]|nr:FliM/FliN family flagellar motor switch protein [Paracoccaceae bacterium]